MKRVFASVSCALVSLLFAATYFFTMLFEDGRGPGRPESCCDYDLASPYADQQILLFYAVLFAVVCYKHAKNPAYAGFFFLYVAP